MTTALGSFIRQTRIARGLLQKQVAYDVGMDVTHLSGLETGRRRYLGRDLADRLSKALVLNAEECAVLHRLRDAARGHLDIPVDATADEVETISLLARLFGGQIEPQQLKAVRALIEDLGDGFVRREVGVMT